jgi:hypothetical protein
MSGTKPSKPAKKESLYDWGGTIVPRAPPLATNVKLGELFRDYIPKVGDSSQDISTIVKSRYGDQNQFYPQASILRAPPRHQPS